MALAPASVPGYLRRTARAFGATLFLTASTARAETPDRLLGSLTPILATKPLRIGVTIVHLNHAFWKGIAYGITEEARRGV